MKKLTQEEFINKAKTACPDIDFSTSIYTNMRTKVFVNCKLHGEFSYFPKAFILGTKCPECDRIDRQNVFIEKAKKIHGNKYDYTQIHYINNDTPIKIICKEHGPFYQTPSDHLKGYGCGWCSGKQKHTTETWVKKVKDLYGGKYTFEHTKYINNKVKVIVTCPDHGDFEVWPNNFAKEQQGCCLCHNSSQNNLFNKLQHEFSSEIIKSEYSPEWLGLQRFDIYFPKYNIAIEYDGEQHFVPIKYFGGEITFKKCQLLDKLKNDKCEKNDCKLFRVKYNYTDSEFESLVSDIKNIINKYTEKE